MLKTLTYVSKINKNDKEIKKLYGTSMRNIKICFDEKENKVKYEEYFFNGLPSLNYILKDKNMSVDLNSLNVISTIIDKENELKIKEWINPNKNISFELLYKTGEKQFKASDFHKYCDNKGPTLILIETTKGYKFGGYTSLDWESPIDTLYKTDDDTFLFNINQMKKYPKIREGRSIFVDKNYGPGFGEGCDLLLGYPRENEGEGTNSNYLKAHELTNGEKNFILKKVEVFKVRFN